MGDLGWSMNSDTPQGIVAVERPRCEPHDNKIHLFQFQFTETYMSKWQVPVASVPPRFVWHVISISSLIIIQSAGVVLDVTHNAEWASGRDNYAHFLLAGVSSIVQALERAHLLSATPHLQLMLSPGLGLWSEDASLDQWEGRMMEMFSPWDMTLNGTASAASPRLNCAVPHLSFCDPEYWAGSKFPVLRSFLRSRPQFVQFYDGGPPAPAPADPSFRVFVVLRSSSPTTGRRAGHDIIGLREACESYAFRTRGSPRLSVECGSFSADEPLVEVAEKLSVVNVLIAAHGAGLANMLFLPDGATVIELDSTAHAASSRPFFQHLAASLSLPADKIWLDFPRGRRHFEEAATEEEGASRGGLQDRREGEIAGDRLVLPPLQHCRRFRPSDNSSIDDKSPASLREARILPYTGKARITDSFFARLIDDLAAAHAQRQQRRGREAKRGGESSGNVDADAAFCGA